MLQLYMAWGFFVEKVRWILSAYVFSLGNLCTCSVFLLAFILYITFNLAAFSEMRISKEVNCTCEIHTLSESGEQRKTLPMGPFSHISATEKAPLGTGSLGENEAVYYKMAPFLPLLTCLAFQSTFLCELFIFCPLIFMQVDFTIYIIYLCPPSERF